MGKRTKETFFQNKNGPQVPTKAFHSSASSGKVKATGQHLPWGAIAKRGAAGVAEDVKTLEPSNTAGNMKCHIEKQVTP